MFREELDLSVEKYLFQLYKITPSKVNRNIKMLENNKRKMRDKIIEKHDQETSI